MADESICSICLESQDILVTCRLCRKHGWCMECDARIERCPLCRSGFALGEPESQCTDADGYAWCTVSRIMSYRMQVNPTCEVTTEYLIEWDGGFRSWESEDWLNVDIPHLIQQYWWGQTIRSKISL